MLAQSEMRTVDVRAVAITRIGGSSFWIRETVLDFEVDFAVKCSFSYRVEISILSSHDTYIRRIQRLHRLR